MIRAALIASALLLASCTSSQQQTTIASLEVSLAAAETIAGQYRRLPLCTGTTQLCQNPAITANLLSLDLRAYDAIKAVERAAVAGAPVELTAAIAALQAMQVLVDVLPRSAK